MGGVGVPIDLHKPNGDTADQTRCALNTRIITLIGSQAGSGTSLIRALSFSGGRTADRSGGRDVRAGQAGGRYLRNLLRLAEKHEYQRPDRTASFLGMLPTTSSAGWIGRFESTSPGGKMCQQRRQVPMLLRIFPPNPSLLLRVRRKICLLKYQPQNSPCLLIIFHARIFY